MSNKRLEHFWENQKQIEDRIQEIKAQESTEKRKEDTRKKILLGAMVMHLIETGYWQKEEIYKQLDKFLDKPIERQLFGLSELEQDEEEEFTDM